MMSDDQLFDALRNIFVLLWFCTLFASLFVNGANHGTDKLEIEFQVFRLQQFETSGKMYGSKAWKV